MFPPFLVFTFFLTLLSSISYAGQHSVVDAFLNQDIEWLLSKAKDDRHAEIRIKVASTMHIDSVLIWNQSKHLVYPRLGLQSFPLEERLANSEADFREMLDHASTPVWRKADLSGNKLYTCQQQGGFSLCLGLNTPALSKRIGISPQELLSQLGLAETFTPYPFWVLLVATISGIVLVIFVIKQKISTPSPPMLTLAGIGSCVSKTSDNTDLQIPNEQTATVKHSTLSEGCFVLGDMTVDEKRMRITRPSHRADISQRDLKLLRYFALHPDQVISKEAL
ncbi:MAG: hypothetical protein ACPGPF_08690, partial [Pontibacterium sp.]